MSLDLEASVQERHERFVERVAASGEVWGLRNDDGWCCTPSNEEDEEDLDDEEAEGLMVIPFWSDRAYAQRCAIEEWSIYTPTAIPLELFLEEWLPGMDEQGDLAGTNWNAELVGLEIEPLDLKAEIEARLAESKG